MITNTKLQQRLQGLRYLWMLCAMLLMFTQQAWGADAIKDTYRYSSMLDGIDQIRLKFPVYDPHGIVIPGKWAWPTETTCIKDAYPKFVDWAKDITDADAKDWYKYPVKGKVISKESYN